MQLKIYINLKNNLILPINYLHILQGIIYTSLKDDKEYQDKLHNNKKYKFFCFNNFKGNYTIENKNIIFHNSVSFEIRSIDSYFIHLIYEYMNKNGIKINNHIYMPKLTIQNKTINENEVNIKMLSPLCLIHKDLNSNKTICLSPRDDNFMNNLNTNFKKKYEAYYNTIPNSDINLEEINVFYSDKVVTTIKGIYITGWKGNYILSGNPDYLTFLYNTGLGSRNSQGFGLFEIIDE